MDPQRWQRLRSILEEALELEEARRADFLRSACGDDAELIAEVEAMLAADAATSGHLEPLTKKPFVCALDAPSDLPQGTRLGPYEILSSIASGGMGSVYRARRADDHFEKEVAIKLIKAGLGSEAILERFQRERQLLADLDHPGIARLLDGGASDDGRPYLVMEYVPGISIVQYCDEQQLSTRAILTLFKKVCAAVHHAHRALVVHRDLKPGNILVTAEGEPKLLDFGIAKVLPPEDLSETQPGGDTGLMTPEYASPEQVRGIRITTATDVYSLGVILYELLTGHRPYLLETGSRFELEQKICEQQPERPSTKVKQETTRPASGRLVSAEEVAEWRRAHTRELRGRLAGDLDNIVLLALRKEPEGRYASVEQFAQDIQRHLDGRPVMARPRTFWYLTGKFVRRNRVSVAIGAALVLALATGFVTSSNLYFQAVSAGEREREQRGLAEGRLVDVELARHAENIERERAERRFKDVRALVDELIFDVSGDLSALRGSTRARERIVKRALAYLDTLALEATDDRELQTDLARAYLKVGSMQGGLTNANLGEHVAARASITKARAIVEPLFLADETIERERLVFTETLRRLGDLEVVRGDLDAALELYERAYDLTLLEGHDPSDAMLEARAETHHQLALLFAQRGAFAPSLEQSERAFEIADELVRREASSAARRRRAASRNDLAEAQQGMNLGAQAEEQYRLAIEELDALLALDAQDTDARTALADSCLLLGQYLNRDGRGEQGLEMMNRSVSLLEAAVAEDAADMQALRNLAVTMRVQAFANMSTQRFVQAAEILRAALAHYEHLCAAEQENAVNLRGRAMTQHSLAEVLLQLDDPEGALEWIRAAKSTFDALYDADPSNAEVELDSTICCAILGKTFRAIAQAAVAGTEADGIDQGLDALAESTAWFDEALQGLERARAAGRLAPRVIPVISVVNNDLSHNRRLRDEFLSNAGE